MNYKDYLTLGRLPNPYFVKISNDGKLFYFIGTKHSFNPNDPSHKVIKHYWQDFLIAIGNRKPIILIEGGKISTIGSEVELIRKYGEAGLVAFLAAQKGWSHDSPEPNLKEEVLELKKEFAETEILAYYFTRRAAQWNRLSNKPNFWNYVRNSLLKDNEKLGWTLENLSQESLADSFNKLSGSKFVETDYKLLNELSDPTRATTRINLVSRRSGQIRDKYIVQTIVNYWRNGESIFAVYGKTHVVMQEPVLKKLLI